MTVDFDPQTGTLVADEATLDVLLRQVSNAVIDAPNSGEALAALRAAGALPENERAHPALDAALKALLDPCWSTLSLSYAGKTLHGWVSETTATLLMPAGGHGRRKLLRLHPSLLPEGLARAADLSLRSRYSQAIPLDTLPDAVTITRWWRLSAAWSGPDRSRDGRMLEVVDTSSGLFTVEPGPGDAGRLAVPAAPTWIWRLLVRLIARRQLDGLQPLPLDADVPGVDGGPEALTDLGTPVGGGPAAGEWSRAMADTAWEGTGECALTAATARNRADTVSTDPSAVVPGVFDVGEPGSPQRHAGESVIGYGQWGQDPARACGTSAFKIVTAVRGTGNTRIRGAEAVGRLPTVEDTVARAARSGAGTCGSDTRATRLDITRHADATSPDRVHDTTPRVGSVGEALATQRFGNDDV